MAHKLRIEAVQHSTSAVNQNLHVIEPNTHLKSNLFYWVSRLLFQFIFIIKILKTSSFKIAAKGFKKIVKCS